MSGSPERRRLLTSARADLLEGHPVDLPAVPDHVVASWRRSLASGVSPVSVRSRYVTELDLGARLVRCARPVIDQLADELADVPMCVALTDAKARVVARKDGNSWISQILDRVYFAQGFDYAEEAVGTNGVGTVLEYGESVQIVGAEHFVDDLQSFACAGAPVRNPFTGRIEGVLDISCLSQHSTPIMGSMVRSAARRVERNLLLDRSQAQQALFELFTRVDARTREAVLAVGPNLVMANTAMEAMLGSTDQAALSDHLRFLTRRRHDRVDDQVVLPSGLGVRLHGSAREVGDEVVVVAVVTAYDDAGPSRARPGAPAVPAPTSTTPTPPSPGGSPAWCTASATVERALREARGVLVLGEPGTGRATLLRSTYARVAPGGRVVEVDAGEVGCSSYDDLVGGAAEQHRPTLVLLRDLDRLDRAAGRALVRAMSERPSEVRTLAATGSPGGVGSDLPLLALLEESVDVPPLRDRSVDLPVLVRAVLAEIDPRGRVRVSEDALRLLARHPWPGNVRELRETLVAAVARRPVGTIDAHDLPAQCQSSPRSSLREVDKVERDAIVAALRRLGGNRKAAASSLGIARSTLYRKIRQYGITD